MLIKFINKLVNNIKSKRDKIIIPKAINLHLFKAKNKNIIQLTNKKTSI
jgi:hypothetical protein